MFLFLYVLLSKRDDGGGGGTVLYLVLISYERDSYIPYKYFSDFFESWILFCLSSDFSKICYFRNPPFFLFEFRCSVMLIKDSGYSLPFSPSGLCSGYEYPRKDTGLNPMTLFPSYIFLGAIEVLFCCGACFLCYWCFYVS